MTNYSTIANGSPASRSSTPGDMNRQRRGRGIKDGSGGHASMLSSNINLVNTIVGAGTLAMPAALSHYGIALGTCLIMWCGITSAFGLYLQARSARYLDRGTSSFFALSQITYPNAAVVFDAAIAIKCFGVGVSYLIIIGDLMPDIMRGFSSSFGDIPFLVDRHFWVTVFMLIIIPLSFLRRLDSLKYTSVIALVSIAYLIVLVVYHFAADAHPDRGPLRVVTWESPIAALKNLPVMIFAYTCHQNMFSILNEIKDYSPPSVLGVISSSIGSAASIYVLVAITGYMTFGNDVHPNIISMYPPSVASTIGKAAIVIMVMFSVPLQHHPCRASVDAVLRWRPNKAQSLPTAARSSSPQPLMSSSASLGGASNHGSPAVAMSDLRFAVITSVILIGSYMTALTVSSFDRVLAYVGSTGSTSISFILPGLFYYKISDPNSIHHQRLTKEDDDADLDDDTVVERGGEAASSGLLGSVASIRSVVSGTGRRRKWRWDLEHLETGLLRKLALCLSIYGVVVMVVCLSLNLFVGAGSH